MVNLNKHQIVLRSSGCPSNIIVKMSIMENYGYIIVNHKIKINYILKQKNMLY